jgi:hypothetical protein
VRTVFFIAIAANSLDLVATSLGIHWFGNREGNPLLAGVAHSHWWLFVALKGLLVPLLIVRLHGYRHASPVLASAGLGLVTIALVIALGQWLGWMAGVLQVGGLPPL